MFSRYRRGFPGMFDPTYWPIVPNVVDRRALVDHPGPSLLGLGGHLDDVVAVFGRVDERVGDDVDQVAVVPRVVAGRGVGSTGEEEVREPTGLQTEEGGGAVGPVLGEREPVATDGSPCG